MSRAVRHETDELIRQYGPERVTQAMRPLLTDERMARIEQVLDSRLSSLTVAIENLHDPRNGAAAVRSIEAVGLTTLHAAESVEHFRASPAVTIGAEKWIHVARYQGFAACAQALREQGFTLYAACPDAGNGTVDELDTMDVSRPVAVVFGNEHEGLTQGAIDACDRRMRIPMHGFTQSFNLSVSVAVTIYQLARRRRAHLGRPGDLAEQERAILRARWYSLGVRGLRTIVERHVS